jgi:hypothetical protein
MTRPPQHYIFFGFFLLGINGALSPPSYAQPFHHTWSEKVNAATAATTGFLGRYALKHLAYGTVSCVDIFKSGLLTLTSVSGYIPPAINACAQSTFFAMSAYPAIQSAQHGEAAFWTTTALTYLSWRATQLIPHISQRIQNAYAEPWVCAALNASSALIPDPHVDDFGVSIPRPFSNNILFFNDFFKIDLGPDEVTLNLNDSPDCRMAHMEKIVCKSSDKRVVAHFSKDQGMILAWGTSQDIMLAHMPQISRLTIRGAQEPPQGGRLEHRHILHALDQSITNAILTPFPWTAVDATPIVYPFPIRHQNDKRELPQLLREDPDLFLAYLNAHASHYIHDHTYSTAPAMIATLFYDLGVQTGGEVFVFKNGNPALEFDNPMFLFIPPRNSEDPIIVMSLANWSKAGLKRGAQSARLSDFKSQQDTPNTLENHFMRTQEARTRVTTNLLNEFYTWRRHSDHMLDDMVRGCNLWTKLEERLKVRPDLYENPLWCMTTDVNFQNPTPFTIRLHKEDTTFMEGRLRRPRVFSTDALPLKPTTRIQANLYAANIWWSDAFDTEGERLKNLLNARDFGAALDNVKQDFQSMQGWFANAFSQDVMDENIFKVAIATKALNHEMEGGFFPTVEMQSGSGRVDLSLLSYEKQEESVLFEFKYTANDHNMAQKTLQAMHQISGRNYGAAFDRFPGVKSVRRVGITFSPRQINTDFDTYIVPKLLPKIASPVRNLEAFKYQLKTFAIKHISYHDLNARNPDFFPAVLTSIFLESQHQGTSEIWKSLANNADENLFFLKADSAEQAVSILYTTQSQPLSPAVYQTAFKTFHDAHPHIKSLKHMTLFVTGGKEFTLSDISLHSAEVILKNYRPSGPGSEHIPFPASSATIKSVLSNLDSQGNTHTLEHHLKAASEFSNQLFSHNRQQNEAHLQGLIVGTLFAHPDHFDILSLNEEGGVHNSRPDIIFKDTHGKMTVIENKLADPSQSLNQLAQDALDQTVRNRYGDIIQKRDISGFVSASIVFDPNNMQFVVHHDERPYGFNDSRSRRIQVIFPTLREHTPEPEAASSRLASHIATPPMRITRGQKRRGSEVSDLALAPVCKQNRRNRRSMMECYPLSDQEQEHLTLALEDSPRNTKMRNALHGLNTLVGGILPLTKTFIRGDVTSIAQQAALVFVMPTLTHQYNKAATTLANLMDDGLAKTFLKGSAKVVGSAAGGALNILDLGHQVERFAQANTVYEKQSSELSIAVDTGYLVLDSIEMGALLAGAEGGPLFLAATLTLALADQFGQAGIELEKLEDQIQLSGSEKFQEYGRFFFGLGADSYLTQDLEAKAVYKNVFEQLSNNPLKSEQFSTLVATINDIEKVVNRQVPQRTAADRRADDYVHEQSWCLYCDHLLVPRKHPNCTYLERAVSIVPTLTSTSPSVIEFGDAPKQKLSRIATPPPGTRFLCAPGSDDVIASEISRSSHHAAPDGTCRGGDTDHIIRRIHWPSSRETGQPFCQNAFVLQNATHTDGGIIYLLNNDVTHQTPATHPATLYLNPPQDPSKTAHYHITLRHANNVIFSAPSWDRIHFHITGGQHNTLVVQNDFHFKNAHSNENFIQNIDALIGSPASQQIAGSPEVKFIDGGGGIDIIRVLSDATVVLHNATHIHLFGDRVSVIWPGDNAGLASIQPFEERPHTYNLILNNMRQLNRIQDVPYTNYWMVELVHNASSHTRFSLYINRFQKERDTIFLTFSPPLEDVISQGQVLFYQAPLPHDHRAEDRMHIHLTGTIEPFWHSAIDEQGLSRLSHLGHPRWITTIRLSDPTAQHVLWIDRSSNVTHITQSENNTLSSLTRVVAGPSHHYVIQDWIRYIELHQLSPEHTGTTYTKLSVPEETSLIKGTFRNQNTYLLTQHQPTQASGILKINQAPFKLILEQKDVSYGLFPDTTGSEPSLSLFPTHFLNFHHHCATIVPTDTWHLDDRLRMSTDGFVVLKDGSDGVLFDAHRNATLVLKGLKSYITFRNASALWLETPNRSINLQTVLDHATNIQGHIARQRRTVLNEHPLFKAMHAPLGETQAPHNGTIFIDDQVVYDIRAHEGSLDVFVRNQTGDLSLLNIQNWDTMTQEERPLMVDAHGLIDLRNHTADALEANVKDNHPDCSKARVMQASNNPYILWIQSCDLPSIHLETTSSGFSVYKNFVDKRHVRGCSESTLFQSDAEVYLMVYDHVTPYTDISHNETGSFYHISPALWPLRVRRAENDLSITPTSFEDAKTILDRAEMIH